MREIPGVGRPESDAFCNSGLKPAAASNFEEKPKPRQVQYDGQHRNTGRGARAGGWFNPRSPSGFHYMVSCQPVPVVSIRNL